MRWIKRSALTRSGLNWFLLSLLLGPIATFVLVISDKLRDRS